MRISILVILLVVLAGCPQQPDSQETLPRQGSGPKLGQKFTIGYGREVRLEDEGLEIRFASVTSDSRCPSDPEVKCVWEGYAQIAVQLSKGGEDTASIKLNTPSPLQQKYPSENSYLDYTVKLVKLSPYPKTAGGIETAEYKATLLVAKR